MPVAHPDVDRENQGKESKGDDDLNCVAAGNEGRCIPYYMCESPPNISQEVGIIDIADTPCKSYLEVCCELKHTLSVPPTYAPHPKSDES